jgi:hypothetical protein
VFFEEIESLITHRVQAMTGPPTPSNEKPKVAAASSNNNHGSNTTTNDDGSCVQVAVRVRPMLPHEAGNTQCIEVLSTNNNNLNSKGDNVMTVVRLGGDSGPKFAFDQVFPLATSQLEVYEHRVAPLVTSCLEGYNATIVAYGQTGSGKTHTIMGPSASITTSVQDEKQAGVIPRAIRSVFDQLQDLQDKITKENSENENAKTSFEYDVRVQFLEVYGEEIRDLLSVQQPSQKLSIRDVGLEEPEVVGATERKVDSAEEALLCLTRGMYRRVTGATAMNESSSRSHAILSLIVEQSTNTLDDETKTENSQDKRSKFNFVDLAGSERQKRTQSSGQRLKEGIDINKGLLVLGNVISALGDPDPKRKGKIFVPYRDSKLTRLLKGSLGGNHKTLMIACASPAAVNMEETLNCLRYANRAKNIQNHAVVNVDATSRLVSELKAKIQLLASDLLKSRDGKSSECTIPIEVVEQLANGGDGQGLASPDPSAKQNFVSPSPIITPKPSGRQSRSPNQSKKIASSSSTTTTTTTSKLEEELQKIKAENEVYRLRLESQTTSDDEDPADALQLAFIARAQEYEREIAMLRQGKNSPSHHGAFSQPDFGNTISQEEQQPYLPNLPPRTPNRRTPSDSEKFVRSESPELSRLRAQAFGSMSQSQNLDAEMEAEEKAVGDLTVKYLKKSSTDADMDDSLMEEDDDDDAHLSSTGATPEEDSSNNNRQKLSVKLEGDLFELSTSIDAKEDLIQKLMLSQQKYEVRTLPSLDWGKNAIGCRFSLYSFTRQ